MRSLTDAPQQVIVLAAGRGNQAHGMAKALIRHPVTRKTVLEHVAEAFSGKRIIVVVGFRAIQVMDHFPGLEFVINEHWADTNNAMSLGLALELSIEATYVIPGDVFMDRSLVDELDATSEDLALTSSRENRVPSAIHGVVDSDRNLIGTYQGAIRDNSNPELIGTFKISTPGLLARWRQQSMLNGHQFAGQTLPCDEGKIATHDVGDHLYDEVNTASDYLRIIERGRRS